MLRIPLAVLTASVTGLVALAAACGSGDAPPADTNPTSTGGTSTAPTSTSKTPPPNNEVPDATTQQQPDADAEVLGPVTPVRFVAMGDTGKGCSNSADPQCAVADAIKEKCAKDGCDFGLLLGDNIYPSGAASATDTVFDTVFEQPYKDLTFPFYVALGNHDYGANGAGTDFARGKNEIDYTQHSQKWKMPANYYRQMFGNGALEVFVTDTNMAMFQQEAQQRADLKSWMSSSKAIWKIATGHHPYLSNGDHGNAGCYDGYEVPGVGCVSIPPADGSGVKSFLEDAVCGNVDFYICGHDHSRQWLEDKCKGTELVVSGGGAATTALDGKNKTYWEEASSGFFYVSIDGKTLKAEFINAQGNVDFSRTITKP